MSKYKFSVVALALNKHLCEAEVKWIFNFFSQCHIFLHIYMDEYILLCLAYYPVYIFSTFDFFLIICSEIERIYWCIWVRGGISNKPIFCSGNMLTIFFYILHQYEEI